MQKTMDRALDVSFESSGDTKETPLPEIAHLVLSVGRMLLEWGANARTVHEAISNTATGLGCDSADAFCQHAAIIVVLRRGDQSHTQMGKVGEHVVNLRRTQTLQEIIQRIVLGELTCGEAQAEVDQVVKKTKHYPVWFVCLATGLACSGFGRLFKSDWVSFLPTLLGAGIGQYVRHTLFHRKYNIFLTAGTVSFIAAMIAGLGARTLGSTHLPLAMVASVLLLVPGIPVLNAQIDVIEGKPNLAAARALRITFLLLFMALGLSMAQGIVLPPSATAAVVPPPPEMDLWLRVLHQAFFGGLAAAGFGVLFNTPPRILGLCFASGAFALAIRTTCQNFDLGLPLSSFIAALSLATLDRTWHRSQTPLGSVLAVVGCIAMVPGSLAAKGLMGLFALVHAKPDDTLLLTSTMENMIIVTFTLVSIGIGLIIPTLVYPDKQDH
jgi:uncharacterized membrane protein YjjP (DUF1212 family)